MSNILEFIKEHVELIGSLLITLLYIIFSVISFLRKRKTLSIYEKQESITSFLATIIDEAELTFFEVEKSGENKLKYVLNSINGLCSKIGLTFDSEYWSSKIEAYLSTPTKK